MSSFRARNGIWIRHFDRFDDAQVAAASDNVGA
jgi:hypothetical protein